jgi:hypothetical protein
VTGRPIERAAKNEALFREANDDITARREELEVPSRHTPYICECEEEGCTTIVLMTLDEYRSVRAHPTRFLIAPGHRTRQSEQIEANDRFEVVEKYGEAGEVAEEEY